MNRIVAMGFGLLASVGRGLSVPFLMVGSVGSLILQFSAACERAAREWDPRLWDRNHDPRSDSWQDRP